jgi:hypothetical protein
MLRILSSFEYFLLLLYLQLLLLYLSWFAPLYLFSAACMRTVLALVLVLLLLPKSKSRYNWLRRSKSNVEGTLRLTVSQSVCLGIKHPCGTYDQILLPVRMLLSEICGLVSVGRPLWREDGSAICSVITQWSESLRSCNHTLLSHLRLPSLEG